MRRNCEEFIFFKHIYYRRGAKKETQDRDNMSAEGVITCVKVRQQANTNHRMREVCQQADRYVSVNIICIIWVIIICIML